MIVKELINERLNLLRSNDTVETAIDYLVTEGISELPIAESNVLSITRLEPYECFRQGSIIIGGNPLNPHTPVASENQHLFEMIPIWQLMSLELLQWLTTMGCIQALLSKKNLIN